MQNFQIERQTNGYKSIKAQHCKKPDLERYRAFLIKNAAVPELRELPRLALFKTRIE